MFHDFSSVLKINTYILLFSLHLFNRFYSTSYKIHSIYHLGIHVSMFGYKAKQVKFGFLFFNPLTKPWLRLSVL